MYNKDQKEKFIADIFNDSLSNYRMATGVFKKTEQAEIEANKDICFFNLEELKKIIENNSQMNTISITNKFRAVISKYVIWCKEHGIDGVSEDILRLDYSNNAPVLKKHGIKSPFHLQTYLNSVFDEEGKCTIDLAYRCIFWMVYSGLKVEDTLLVTTDDVDLYHRLFHYNGIPYKIYNEGFFAFESAKNLNEFLYCHPLYTPRMRSRSSGKAIVRGFRETTSIGTILSYINSKANKALCDGKIENIFSLNTDVLRSGVFYRAYIDEFNGRKISRPVNMAPYIPDGIENNYQNQRVLFKQYNAWKAAFNL